jgi:hypothetical protein
MSDTMSTIKTAIDSLVSVYVRLERLEYELARAEKHRDTVAEALLQCREDSIELLGERDWWKNEPRCNYQIRYEETAENIRRADAALAAAKGGTP